VSGESLELLLASVFVIGAGFGMILGAALAAQRGKQ
jgi:hypothetical protein